MANSTLNRCVWLVDTIRRYGRITRKQLEKEWLESPHGDGKPLTRRTFCNHRDAAEDLFNIIIKCDGRTFEYYIDGDEEGGKGKGITDWLLQSVSINDSLKSAQDISERIFLEDIPSAGEFLSQIIKAMKGRNRIRFDYHSYTRATPTLDIDFDPYLLKIFKQRWYVVGMSVARGQIRTYALDRFKALQILPEQFKMARDFNPKTYFKYSYGIVVDKSEPRKVVLKVDPAKAKYLRSVPLHNSQKETVGDKFSLFTYRIRITDDLVAELLSHGTGIVVVEPHELRVKMLETIRQTLRNYGVNMYGREEDNEPKA